MKSENDQNMNSLESNTTNDSVPSTLTDIDLDHLKQMHIKGRAIRINETLEEYTTERQESWEKEVANIERQSGVLQDAMISTQQAGNEFMVEEQANEDAKKISDVKKALGINDPSAENISASIPETSPDASEKVNKDLLDYIMSDKTTIDKLGYIVPNREEKALLDKVKNNFRKAAHLARGTTSKMSIREFVFNRMPDSFEDYDTLLFKSKSISFQAKEWVSLSPEQKDNFKDCQIEAADIFRRLISGEEFLDIALTQAEIELIEKTRALSVQSGSKKTNSSREHTSSVSDNNLSRILTGTNIENVFSTRDKLVYENFIQKTSFKIAKKERTGDEALPEE